MNIKTHQEQFNILYEALHQISDIKKIQDKMAVHVKSCEADKASCAAQNKVYYSHNRILLEEKDKYLKSS